MRLPRQRLLIIVATASIPLGAAAAVTTAHPGAAPGPLFSAPAGTPAPFPPLRTPSPGAPHNPGPDHLAATDSTRRAQPVNSRLKAYQVFAAKPYRGVTATGYQCVAGWWREFLRCEARRGGGVLERV